MWGRRKKLVTRGAYVLVWVKPKVEIHDRRIYFDPHGRDSYVDEADNMGEAHGKIDRWITEGD